uniref:Uncharacterized protein n=1 Tax=Glossina palpalis gambiensis TaxID=67801 RepID=A0A1B0B352_9MUSC
MYDNLLNKSSALHDFCDEFDESDRMAVLRSLCRPMLNDSRFRYEFNSLRVAIECERQLPTSFEFAFPLQRLLISVVWLSFTSAKIAAASTLFLTLNASSSDILELLWLPVFNLRSISAGIEDGIGGARLVLWDLRFLSSVVVSAPSLIILLLELNELLETRFLRLERDVIGAAKTLPPELRSEVLRSPVVCCEH